jgi:hypothetical protein
MALVSGSNTGPAGIPPGGPYFVFPLSGTIQRQSNPVLAEGLAVSGWIGFPDMAAAENYAHNQSIAHAADQTVKSTAGIIAELSNPNLWLRVAEVALGLVLVAVGIARLTGVDNKIQQLAETTAKAAVVA